MCRELILYHTKMSVVAQREDSLFCAHIDRLLNYSLAKRGLGFKFLFLFGRLLPGLLRRLG